MSAFLRLEPGDRLTFSDRETMISGWSFSHGEQCRYRTTDGAVIMEPDIIDAVESGHLTITRIGSALKEAVDRVAFLEKVAAQASEFLEVEEARTINNGDYDINIPESVVCSEAFDECARMPELAQYLKEKQ